MAGAGGVLLAIALGLDCRGINPEFDKIVAYCQTTHLAQRQIVFTAPPFIRVPLVDRPPALARVEIRGHRFDLGSLVGVDRGSSSLINKEAIGKFADRLEWRRERDCHSLQSLLSQAQASLRFACVEPGVAAPSACPSGPSLRASLASRLIPL